VSCIGTVVGGVGVLLQSCMCIINGEAAESAATDMQPLHAILFTYVQVTFMDGW
jgi:hypothetical protein